MKKSFTVFFLFIAALTFAQSNDYSSIPASNEAECRAAEPSVISAANLVLSKPLYDKTSYDAYNLLIRWEARTEYTITINNRILDLMKKGNKNLQLVYLACYSKFLLEHKDLAKDETAIEVGAYTLLADYISDPAHDVTITKEVQKLLDAKRDGKVAEFIKRTY